MPLPDNGPLSLHVHSSLGNAVQSKPKQAMIIRMSAETLEALESFPNHPEMHFDFGDNPGIYIGETFYPMRSQKESSPHEIYLRTSSAAKPNVPLKLYANVIGKFMVERQLGAKITDGVRQRTIEAKKAHSERQAILLEQPPIPTPGFKPSKRKAPGTGTVVKKSVPSMDQLRVASSSTAPPRKVSPLPHNPPSSKANADVRRRLVHCLAIQSRLADDAIRMVGGANISVQAREDLLGLLEDVAEQTAPPKKGDKSPRPWTLRPHTWTEVRPYEWPKLTEAERTAMARQARLAFKALKIPESDPAWDNVRYRSTAPVIGTPLSNPLPAASSGSRSLATVPPVSTPTQPEPKRPVMSKETKQKTKSDASRTKGGVSMKDESAKVSAPRVVSMKKDETERLASSSSDSTVTKSVPTRRLPGSGYQVKKIPQAFGVAADGVTAKPATSGDARPPQRHSLPAPLPSKPSSPLPQLPSVQARKAGPVVPSKPARRVDESDRERDKEMEREREREQRDREKRRELKLKEREREKLAMERATPSAGSKRKTANLDPIHTQDEESSSKTEPIPKKRKVEEGILPAATSSSSRPRDLQLPKKLVQETVPPLRQKIKKEQSPPLRGSLSGQGRLSPSPSQLPKVDRPKINGTSMKTKRKSPIYTSSEDEGEIPQPELQTRQRKPSPLPSVTDYKANGKDFRHRPRLSYPLPSDHAALRARYRSSYTDYLDTFSKIVIQKQKIEAILKGESESDVDLMDPEELTKLSLEHKILKEELEAIQEMYMKGKNSPSSE
ncbi:hypothetical protein V8B97DRAFT_1936433 [Scleroderma yunnanense]